MAGTLTAVVFPGCFDCVKSADGDGGELAEGGVGPRAVDGGRTAVHQYRHADGLGRLLLRCSSSGCELGVRGDASVAALDHTDRQRDELLVLRSSWPSAKAA